MKRLLWIWGIMLFGLGACSEPSLEEQINITIKQDARFLATLDAVYLSAFINVTENTIASDDIYMRIDKGTVSYGFDLDNITVRIVQQGDDRVLKVRLPAPQKAALDREALWTHNVHEHYQPLDEKGNELDVAAQLTHQLNEIDRTYGEQTRRETRRLAEQYFDGLAKKFGLRRTEIEFL